MIFFVVLKKFECILFREHIDVRDQIVENSTRQRRKFEISRRIVHLTTDQDVYKRLFIFSNQKLLEKIESNSIEFDFIASRQRDSVDVRVCLSQSRESHDDIVSYLEKRVEHLRRNVLTLSIISNLEFYNVDLNESTLDFIESLCFQH